MRRKAMRVRKITHHPITVKNMANRIMSILISVFSAARHLAVNYGLTGCGSLPPGIAKKTVLASMLGQRPYYPGYEWKIVRNDFVLIALSTSVVTAIINGVFD